MDRSGYATRGCGRRQADNPAPSAGRDGAVRDRLAGAQTARPQLATWCTMAESLASVASSSAVKYHADSMSWCGAPSSRVRFASWVKPNVMYFLSARKKQTVLPSLAYAGMPYHTAGWSAGALRKMSAWRRSAGARGGLPGNRVRGLRRLPGRLLLSHRDSHGGAYPGGPGGRASRAHTPGR